MFHRLNFRRLLAGTLSVAMLVGCHQPAPTTPQGAPASSAPSAPASTAPTSQPTFVGLVAKADAGQDAMGETDVKVFRLGQDKPIASGKSTKDGEFIVEFGSAVPSGAAFKLVATNANGQTVGTVAVSQVLSPGNGSVIAPGGGNVIAPGGGNVIAAGGGNVIAPGGGNVIAPGGGNVIAPGGGNVIAPGGGNVIAAGGGNYHVKADDQQAVQYRMTPATTLALVMLQKRFEAAGKAATTGDGNTIAEAVQGIITAFNALSQTAEAALPSLSKDTVASVLTSLNSDGQGSLDSSVQSQLASAAPSLTTAFTQAAQTLSQAISTGVSSGGTAPSTTDTSSVTFGSTTAPAVTTTTTTTSGGATSGGSSSTTSTGSLALAGDLNPAVYMDGAAPAIAGVPNGLAAVPSALATTVPGSQARFDNPQGIARLANGALVVADTNNNALQLLTVDPVLGTWNATTLLTTGLHQPHGLCAGAVSGSVYTVYVADSASNSISRVDIDFSTTPPSATPVTVVAGGSASTTFNNPQGVSAWFTGSSVTALYVADTDHNQVKRVDMTTSPVTIQTVSGGATAGRRDGTASLLSAPTDVLVLPPNGDGFEHVFVADRDNFDLRTVQFDPANPTLSITGEVAGAGNGLLDQPVSLAYASSYYGVPTVFITQRGGLVTALDLSTWVPMTPLPSSSLTQVPIPFGEHPAALVWDNAAAHLYFTDFLSQCVTSFSPPGPPAGF